ncbi:hypothetical protein [Pseudorhodoferax sp.]|uniref:hypothetical protein n=1 Tax=Pseudorhodoferax sp. TaxID=1993553 RepID=UPI0039E2F8F3
MRWGLAGKRLVGDADDDRADLRAMVLFILARAASNLKCHAPAVAPAHTAELKHLKRLRAWALQALHTEFRTGLPAVAPCALLGHGLAQHRLVLQRYYLRPGPDVPAEARTFAGWLDSGRTAKAGICAEHRF